MSLTAAEDELTATKDEPQKPASSHYKGFIAGMFSGAAKVTGA
jgi:hypothetical protein